MGSVKSLLETLWQCRVSYYLYPPHCPDSVCYLRSSLWFWRSPYCCFWLRFCCGNYAVSPQGSLKFHLISSQQYQTSFQGESTAGVDPLKLLWETLLRIAVDTVCVLCYGWKCDEMQESLTFTKWLSPTDSCEGRGGDQRMQRTGVQGPVWELQTLQAVWRRTGAIKGWNKTVLDLLWLFFFYHLTQISSGALSIEHCHLFI